MKNISHNHYLYNISALDVDIIIAIAFACALRHEQYPRTDEHTEK